LCNCTISKTMLATLLLNLFTANMWLQKEKRPESVRYYYYYNVIFYIFENNECWLLKESKQEETPSFWWCPSGTKFSTSMAYMSTGICLSVKICVTNLLLNLYREWSLIKAGAQCDKLQKRHLMVISKQAPSTCSKTVTMIKNSMYRYLLALARKFTAVILFDCYSCFFLNFPHAGAIFSFFACALHRLIAAIFSLFFTQVDCCLYLHSASI